MLPSDESELLRALTTRLTSGGQVLVGAIPPNLPFDLPLPEGTRVFGSVVHSEFRHPSNPDYVIRPERIEIHLEVPGTTADLVHFYTAMCRARGWTVPHTPPPPQDEGPLYIPLLVPARGVDGRYFRANIGRDRDGRCAVCLEFGTYIHEKPDQPRFPFDEGLFRLLDPILRLPGGLRGTIRMEGGYGGGHYATQEAFVLGDYAVAEIEAVVSELCRQAGWVRRSGGVDGPIAWSCWSLPNGDRYDGWVLVMDGPGPERLTIQLRVNGLIIPDDGRRDVLAFSDASEPHDQ